MDQPPIQFSSEVLKIFVIMSIFDGFDIIKELKYLDWEGNIDIHMKAAITLIGTFGKDGLLNLCNAIASIIQDNSRLRKELQDIYSHHNFIGKSYKLDQQSLNRNLDKLSQLNDTSSSCIPECSYTNENYDSVHFESSVYKEHGYLNSNCKSTNMKIDDTPGTLLKNIHKTSYDNASFEREDGFYQSNYSLNDNLIQRNDRTISLSRIKKGYRVKVKFHSMREKSLTSKNLLHLGTTMADIHLSPDSQEGQNCSINSANFCNSQINEGDFVSYFPLSGCQCSICREYIVQRDRDFYVFKVDGCEYLPNGSRVLMRNGKIGTVVYLGHEDKENMIDTGAAPIGISVILEDKSTSFFSLNDIEDILNEEIEVIDLRSDSNNSSIKMMESPCSDVELFTPMRESKQKLDENMSIEILNLGECISEIDNKETTTYNLNSADNNLSLSEDSGYLSNKINSFQKHLIPRENITRKCNYWVKESNV